MEYEVSITWLDDTGAYFEIDFDTYLRLCRDINNGDMAFIYIDGKELKYIWPEGNKQLVEDYQYSRYINKDQIKQLELRSYKEEEDLENKCIGKK